MTDAKQCTPDYESFAIALMDAATEYTGACDNIDGRDLQDLAAEYGLLVPMAKVVPCCEACNCQDYADVGEEVVCYRHNWRKSNQ